jgi:hypothetical protein
LFLAAKRRTGSAGGLRRLECAIAKIGATQMNRSAKYPFLDRSFIIGAVLPARTAGGPSKKPCFIIRGARPSATLLRYARIRLRSRNLARNAG